MDPSLSLAVAAGRFTAAAIRRLGRGGGTTLPGRVSAAIDGGVLAKLSANLERGAVLVTGTNGKTTTANLIRTLLEADGMLVVANRAGANLVGGLTAALAQDSHVIRPRPRAEVGVFEVDEASFPAAVEAVMPRVVVVTNLFRDQLDRYGELETSAAAISAGLAVLPAASQALLCGDDPRVAALGEGLRAQVLYYGLTDTEAGEARLPHASDASFCPRCGEPFDFERVYVGHLGAYRCPRGDFERPRLGLEGSGISFTGLDGQTLTLSGLGVEGSAVEVPLSGLYNSYNILAAAGAARLMGVPAEVIVPALRGFHPAFGRLEQVDVDGRRLRLMLAKNPASFNEVLRASRLAGGSRGFLVAVNDRIADGRDVSWIWDVDFELLRDAEWVVLGGTRALDMRIRLKYGGLDLSRVSVAEDPGAAIDAALRLAADGDEILILPTYTAMLDLRAELASRGHLRQFWET